MNFETQMWIYLSDFQKVSTLQRLVLVHSYLYYELNESVVSDKYYDKISKQLVEKQKMLYNKFGVDKTIQKTDYGNIFEDFDGTTGFDLYYKLSEEQRQHISNIAKFVLSLYRKENKNAKRTD